MIKVPFTARIVVTFENGATETRFVKGVTTVESLGHWNAFNRMRGAAAAIGMGMIREGMGYLPNRTGTTPRQKVYRATDVDVTWAEPTESYERRCALI